MKNFWKVLAVVGVFALITLLTTQLQTLVSAAGETAVQQSPVEVKAELMARFAAGEEPGYLIYFRDKADLSAAYDMDWEARGYFVMETLQAAADASQKEVRAYLDGQRVSYQAFWIDNLIVVQSSDLNTFNGLLNFNEIAEIRSDVENFLIEPEEASREGSLESILAPEPNLVQVKATDTWALGVRGQGTVIANIDSGVRHTHQALVNQYRGNLGGGTFDHNYNWLDPDGGSVVPVDANGHGTHVMGTMVGYDGGANEIGVAPDAEWIACRGCLTSSCPSTALLACAQWIAAPYAIGNPGSADPNMRPYAVNNSWGSCQQSYDPWYQGVVDAWHAAGVYPVFANGNASNCGYPAPPGLNTVGNPARYGNVTGVGSSGTSNGLYATHSNWGPTDNPDTVNPQPGFANLKPQVIAPGVSIRSSLNSGDTAYGSSGWTGTSMSAPHVTGMIALMWEAAGCLIGDYATTETIIEQSARPVPYASGGNPPPGPGNVPNYATGWGEIDVLAAVQMAQAMCGPSGTLEGAVTNSSTSAPVAGASIVATLDITTTKTATTDALGEYVINFAPEGFYTMTASAFGYLPTTVTNVEVVSGTVTMQDFALDPAPSYTVSGVVTDANTDWPLYARISVADVPGSPFWNDPETGAYSITLPGGAAYDFTVEAFVAGYLAENRVVGPFNSNITEDFALDVDAAACVAPGYEPGYTFIYNQDFEANNGGYVVSGVPTDHWQWGTPTVWPNSCASGTSCWGTNLSGNYANSANTVLTSPVIDLSGESGALLAFWNQAWHIESATWDKGYAEVSINGGPWLVMWEHLGATAQVNWTERSFDISAAAGGTAQFRFRLTSDTTVNFPGYYIDDVAIANAACLPKPGGLVVGNVYDENTGAALTGAQVENVGGETATAVITPDPAVDDAFYTIFAPAGSTTLTATYSSQYSAAVANLTVVDGTTQLYDFDLSAGWLIADPDTLTVTVEFGSTGSTTFDLNNLGNAAVNWEISEKDEGFMPFAGEQILVVRWEALNADAMQAALTALGYTYLPVTDAVFLATPVSELLEYEAVFYAGAAPVASLPHLTAYLDAGGSLLIADNDLGFFRGTTPFYQQYLQATYNVDNAGDLLTGEDIMAGFDLDITPDPFPDGFTVGAEGTRIFKYTTNDFAGGSAIERLDYRAIYLAFDMHRVVGDADRDELVERILGFLVAGDVPWLTTTPVTGTLSALGTQLITVDFDASIAEVPEPGVYSALLRVSNDTPYGRLDIPVTMNVTASPTLGLLEGVVQSQGYCDNDPFPAAGAEIVITSGANTWTRYADDNGYYYIYLDESYSPVTVAVSAPGHIGDSATGVVLVGQQTTTQDFDLRWLQPCASVDPASFDVDLGSSMTATQTLTVHNDGAGILNWTIHEAESPAAVSANDRMLLPVPGNAAGIAMDLVSTLGMPLPAGLTPVTMVGAVVDCQAEPGIIIHDDGTVENGYSGNPATITQVRFVDRFTPSTYPASFRAICVAFISQGPPSLNFDIILYDDDGPGGSPGTELGSLPAVATGMPGGVTPVVWHSYDISSLGVSITSGSVYIGVRYAPSNPNVFIASDESTGNPVGFAGGYWWNNSANAWATIQSAFTNYRSLMVRPVEALTGCYSPADLPWVSVSPTSGATGADDSSEVVLTFDSTGLMAGETYTGVICFASNDPVTPIVEIPVSLTVETSEDDGRIEGTVQSLGYCDANPFLAEGAEVVISSGANSWTVYTNANGEYGLWLDAAYSPVDVAVTAPNHTAGSATGVAIVPQDVTTVDFDLRLLEPCVSVDPTAFNVSVGAGSLLALPLTIDNAGAAALNWAIDEAASPTVRMPLNGFFVNPAAVDRANNTGQVAEPAANRVMPLASPLLVTDWSMGFEDITQLPGLGWAQINNSSPLGSTGWFQGNTDVFPAHQGPATSYIGANFNNTGSIGTISNWLLTPEMTLRDGDTISFYTRTPTGSTWADRLELRMSVNGGSTDVGSTATSVGDFTTLLLSVNPDQNATGYPQAWTQYTATISGIGGQANGRLAFRYFVTNAGSSGTNSNFIGIDTVEYELGVPPVGCTAPEDIPWLSVSPTSGTAAADGQSVANVTFDATGLSAGTYEAILCVNSNDPMMPRVEVPVSLTVAEPEAAITLDVTVSLDNECGVVNSLAVDPNTVVYYCYTVTNTGNVMLPNHTITDTVFGHIATFPFDLMPGDSESVVFTQTITADTISTARWTASHAGLGLSAMAEDTVSVTLTTRYLFLPIIMKP